MLHLRIGNFGQWQVKFICARARDIVVATIMTELMQNKIFLRESGSEKNQNKNKTQFATCQFYTLLIAFAHDRGT